MLEFIFLVIGLFIGWNLPQPTFAKSLQDKVISWWKSFRTTQ